MSREILKLVEPSFEFKTEFQAMVAEYQAAGEKHYASMYADAIKDFAKYVNKLRNYANGLNLPQDWVRSSTYWLTGNENQILGCARLRYQLNEHLRFHGGHIGYDIQPSQRRKGYGSLILALTLKKASAQGLKKVLLTCNADNKASARIIEKNGGKFASLFIPDWPQKPLRRYWIELHH